ncbi:hypothetical protein SNEBB_009608 [Seison nebaliae]|nr:hypothetical protein SNEBB_009608 [Seison nebaliae]
MKKLPEFIEYSDEVIEKEMRIPVSWGFIACKRWELRITANQYNRMLNEKKIAPKILCVHGYLDNLNSFRPLINELDVHLRRINEVGETDKYIEVIGVDLPGHGKSDHYPFGMVSDVQNYLLNMRRIIKYVQWEKYSLMGHSMGGMLSTLYSSIYPDEVSSLITFDNTMPIAREEELVVKFAKKSMDRVIEQEERILNLQKNEQLEKNAANNFHIDTGRSDQQINFDKPMTYDSAKRILMNANVSLNDRSAEYLLERSLRPIGQSNYRFRRDIRLKNPNFYYLTRRQVMQFATKIKSPFLHFQMTEKLINLPAYLEMLRRWKIIVAENNEKFLEEEIDGNHHEHMNNPEKFIKSICSFWGIDPMDPMYSCWDYAAPPNDDEKNLNNESTNEGKLTPRF